MSSLLTFPAGRRAKFLIVGVWFAIVFGIGGTGLPDKYMDAQKNDAASYLPGDAESSRVVEATTDRAGGEAAPLVIVFRRDGGLTAADRDAIVADRSELNGALTSSTSPYGEPTFSPDGAAALLQADVTVPPGATGDAEADAILQPVKRARDRVSGAAEGLEVKVTGGAGTSADAIDVFTSINGTLLLATGLLVLVLLVIFYRSPIFWLIPFVTVVFAEITTQGLGYALTQAGVTVNGQAASILTVIVFGAGTDYALLLVARYREELRHTEDKHAAIARALRTAGPAIFASGLTVVVTLFSLSLAELNGTAGLGPIGAMGVAVAMVAMLTLLPAALAIVGRKAFWPFIPRFGTEGADERHGAWRRVGERVAAAPRRVWIGTTVLLLVCALGLLNFDDGLTTGNGFRGEVESVEGQELLGRSFPAGENAPTDILIPAGGDVAAVQATVADIPGVAEVRPGEPGPAGSFLSAVLEPEPYSTAAYDLVPDIRDAAKGAGGEEVIVGGATAIESDVREAAARDNVLLVPLALVIVLLILAGLLRAVVAPLLLVATVVLSFAAALGVGAVVFDVIFGFPGSDPSLPLFAFIFLVALGVDYNIFLMARVREEAVARGTREGTLRGLAVTGGVITSAGIVLAGTFSVLGVLPLKFLTELGFVVAFGVLLDTFLVRSVLVPALVLDIGDRVWWPSSLARPAPSGPGDNSGSGGQPVEPAPMPVPAGGNGAAQVPRAPQ